MNLENIDIVMVGTTHPGNIGAAARAMHNMCISSLVLVNPQCPVGEIADARASGANVILDSLRKAGSLQEAVQDSILVVATSARDRSLPWPEISPGLVAKKIAELNGQSRVALVFGREHSGLTNEELQICHYTVNIPTNPDFSSLNVASAIQVMCYEIFKTVENQPETRQTEVQESAVTSQQLEGFFRHLEQVMITTEFLDREKPGLLMQRLRRLYHRLEMSKNEVDILRGILSSVEKYKNQDPSSPGDSEDSR